MVGRKATDMERARRQLFPPLQELRSAHLPGEVGVQSLDPEGRIVGLGQGGAGGGWKGRRHNCAHHQNSVQDACCLLNLPSPHLLPPSIPSFFYSIF